MKSIEVDGGSGVEYGKRIREDMVGKEEAEGAKKKLCARVSMFLDGMRRSLMMSRPAKP